MKFLDSSVIIGILEGVPDIVESVEERGQSYLTSSICVFEVVDGKIDSGETDVVGIRQQFGGVQALDLNEQIAQIRAAWEAYDNTGDVSESLTTLRKTSSSCRPGRPQLLAKRLS